MLTVVNWYYVTGSRREGGTGEAAQREHQEAELCRGFSGEGTEQAAD